MGWSSIVCGIPDVAIIVDTKYIIDEISKNQMSKYRSLGNPTLDFTIFSQTRPNFDSF